MSTFCGVCNCPIGAECPVTNVTCPTFGDYTSAVLKSAHEALASVEDTR